MAENSTWTIIIVLGCVTVLGLIVVAPGFVFARLISTSASRNIEKERDNIRKHKQSVRVSGGVTAPAVITSAKKTGMTEASFVDFEAEVKPADNPSFLVKFRDELYGDEYDVVGYDVVSEIGRKISVTYDPRDKTMAFLDHYDDEYEVSIKKMELIERRVEFDKLISGNEELKIRGEQAEAVITRVDDLKLSYPQKKSQAMHLCFDVAPKNGPVFKAEGNALIVTTSLDKYSVGKRIYVRYDPQQPEKAVLDTARNKILK